MKLYELTRKDLLSDVDSWTKDKARLVRKANYVGITKDYVAIFKVPSVTAKPSTTYTVKVKLIDYADVEDEEDLNTREKVRLAIAGDLKLSCSCPAFLYFGYKYILTQLDANALDDEPRFPKIKNPKLEGTMCKHCFVAMNVFANNWSRIAKDIESGNFIK